MTNIIRPTNREPVINALTRINKWADDHLPREEEPTDLPGGFLFTIMRGYKPNFEVTPDAWVEVTHIPSCTQQIFYIRLTSFDILDKEAFEDFPININLKFLAQTLGQEVLNILGSDYFFNDAFINPRFPYYKESFFDIFHPIHFNDGLILVPLNKYCKTSPDSKNHTSIGDMSIDDAKSMYEMYVQHNFHPSHIYLNHNFVPVLERLRSLIRSMPAKGNLEFHTLNFRHFGVNTHVTI